MSWLWRRGSAFWRYGLFFCVIGSTGFVFRLTWRAQLLAWPVYVGLVFLLSVRIRPQAPPVPGVHELRAMQLPASGRTADLSAAAPVRAAGTVTMRDAIRNSRLAGHWHPAGDPEADRGALLAGQRFRVTALRRTDSGWGPGKLQIGGQPLTVTWRRAARPSFRSRPAVRSGPAGRARSLPLAVPSRVVLARPVNQVRDRFPRINGRLFTVATIATPDGYEMLAVPTIDLPLVHAALELAAAEDVLH